MKKTYNVDAAYNNMRIDRWVRNNIGNIPQAFIEKSLRNGKIFNVVLLSDKVRRKEYFVLSRDLKKLSLLSKSQK